MPCFTRLTALDLDWIRFLGLLGSGLISALFLALLASQRLESIPSDSVVFVLLFVQWQVLGLTVAKLGIDQVVFATVTRDTTLRYDLVNFLFTRSLPLGLGVSMAIAFIFSPFAGAVALVSILLDVYAVAGGADMNARRQFLVSTVANFLNYPLFFFLLLLTSLATSDINVILSCFAFSSLVRAAWIFSRLRTIRVHHLVRFSAAGSMVAQQLGNYLLYRVDQLSLAFLGAVSSLTLASSEQYVFWAKFPELIASGILILGLFLLPPLLNRTDLAGRYLRIQISVDYWLFLGALAFMIIAAFAVYQLAWDGTLTYSEWQRSIPFLLHSILILPVHAISYLLLGDGQVASLVRNLVLSMAIGAIPWAVAYKLSSTFVLSLVVPIQLATFILATFMLPLLSARPLYRTDL